jgi:16S rRNA (cytosine967-C5)-methyltransferase
MKISPARTAAYQILSRIERSADFAVDLLQGPIVSRLPNRDRNLAVQLVMGVLRWRGDLDFQIEELSGKALSYFDSEILQILRLGVYQIRFLSRIPKPAAVNDSVSLVKAARKSSAAALVNAVLRKCKPAPFQGRVVTEARPEREYLESALRSIPQWIRDRWARNFGPEKASAMVLASQEIPRTHLRIVPLGDERETIQRELTEAGVETTPGIYGRQAVHVKSGEIFQTPVWRQGRLVIQEEASQLVAELVRPLPGQSVLDLCAAPGVKSGQLARNLQEGTLIACDRILRRIQLLEKLLVPILPRAVRLCRVVLDASTPLPFGGCFHRVLADVPCSGTGTLARNPEVKWRLQPKDLPRLAAIQTKILSQALGSLAPGGRLVYATCSVEPEENEEVVAKGLAEFPGYRLLGANDLRQEFPNFTELFDEEGYFRTLPGVQPLDGFFAAVIVRA